MRIYSEVVYDNNKMRGFHDKANDDVVAIITHGIGGNKLGHKFIFKQFADYCTKSNISVMRYDFVGTGESDGLFEDTKHSNQVSQVECIIEKAKEYGYKKIILCSTTIGCYSVWHAKKNTDDVVAYVNWNPIFNFDRYESNARRRVKDDGCLDMKGIYTKPTYIEDLSKLVRTIPELDKPVCILQGELDYEYEFYEAQKHCEINNWKYLCIKEANHLWEGTQVRNKLFQETVNFIKSNT